MGRQAKKFVHKDLDIAGNLEKIKGIWVPAWVFDVSAKSPWHGRNYHTESFAETKYDNDGKRYTEYEERDVPDPVSSTHYGDYLFPVSASKVITQGEIEYLKLKRSDLQSYDESYLDEWQVQTREQAKTEAQEICERRIKELEVQACKREVYELVGCSTTITWNTSSFALLPMFVLSYTCNDGFYRNLINGLTGEVYGDFPVDKSKKRLDSIVKTIAAIVVMVIGLIVFFAVIGHR